MINTDIQQDSFSRTRALDAMTGHNAPTMQPATKVPMHTACITPTQTYTINTPHAVPLAQACTKQTKNTNHGCKSPTHMPPHLAPLHTRHTFLIPQLRVPTSLAHLNLQTTPTTHATPEHAPTPF